MLTLLFAFIVPAQAFVDPIALKWAKTCFNSIIVAQDSFGSPVKYKSEKERRQSVAELCSLAAPSESLKAGKIKVVNLHQHACYFAADRGDYVNGFGVNSTRSDKFSLAICHKLK